MNNRQLPITTFASPVPNYRIQQKNDDRVRIAQDTQTFQANGGKIAVIPQGATALDENGRPRKIAKDQQRSRDRGGSATAGQRKWNNRK